MREIAAAAATSSYPCTAGGEDAFIEEGDAEGEEESGGNYDREVAHQPPHAEVVHFRVLCGE